MNVLGYHPKISTHALTSLVENIKERWHKQEKHKVEKEETDAAELVKIILTKLYKKQSNVTFGNN